MPEKRLYLNLLVFPLLIACLLLGGCPAPYAKQSLKAENFYNLGVESLFYQLYGVKFSRTDPPAVTLEYTTTLGESKHAQFTLGGYDPDKRIGYIVVLENDREEWKKSLQSGGDNVPDLNDLILIQRAALEYQYPVIFITAYEYAERITEDNAIELSAQFKEKLDPLIQSDEVKRWAQAGLYDGSWIKERIEEDYANSALHLNFSHKNLPLVEIPYTLSGGTVKTAAFQLDGYDADKRVGYKFVTVYDEEQWAKDCEAGIPNAIDLTYYPALQYSALQYDFPVIFLYVHNYWAYTVNEVLSKASDQSGINSSNYLIDWIKQE